MVIEYAGGELFNYIVEKGKVGQLPIIQRYRKPISDDERPTQPHTPLPLSPWVI